MFAWGTQNPTEQSSVRVQADLRTVFMPGSEEIERTATKLQKRNFPSVEQIQDSPAIDTIKKIGGKPQSFL